MATSLISAYNIGDTVYFPLFATVRIYQAIVSNIYLKTVDGQPVIFYDLVRSDNNKIVQSVPQTQVYTFPNAKAVLLAYPNTQITKITNLVAP